MTSIINNNNTFEKRLDEATRILVKYPDRIPVICDKSRNSLLPNLEKNKFLVPNSMILGQFKYIIHKHVHDNLINNNKIPSNETLYLFINNISPKTSVLMSELYDMFKSNDGYLYITYSAENTLGGT